MIKLFVTNYIYEVKLALKRMGNTDAIETVMILVGIPTLGILTVANLLLK